MDWKVQKGFRKQVCIKGYLDVLIGKLGGIVKLCFMVMSSHLLHLNML